MLWIWPLCSRWSLLRIGCQGTDRCHGVAMETFVCLGCRCDVSLQVEPQLSSGRGGGRQQKPHLLTSFNLPPLPLSPEVSLTPFLPAGVAVEPLDGIKTLCNTQIKMLVYIRKTIAVHVSELTFLFSFVFQMRETRPASSLPHWRRS